MNAYVVKTKEPREYAEDWIDFGDDVVGGIMVPIMGVCQPIAPVVAETPAQAKRIFLTEFTSRSRSGVETDDWPSLRVRLLVKGTELSPGVHEKSDELWGRIHEVEDHGGKPCDCPEYDPEEWAL